MAGVGQRPSAAARLAAFNRMAAAAQRLQAALEQAEEEARARRRAEWAAAEAAAAAAAALGSGPELQGGPGAAEAAYSFG